MLDSMSVYLDYSNNNFQCQCEFTHTHKFEEDMLTTNL